MNRTILLLGLLLVVGLFPAACSKDSNELKAPDLATEMAARRLGQEALQFEKEERHQRSAELFRELVEKYGNTKYFAEFKAEQEKKGISIESPLVSYTSQRMFKLQNEILQYKKSNGSYPRNKTLSVPRDLWGSSVEYQIFDAPDSDKPYEFWVRSPGPDRKQGTDDDIYLIYAGSKSRANAKHEAAKAEKKEKEGGTAGQQRRTSSLTSKMGYGSSKEGGAVSLKQLKDMAKGGGTTGSIDREKRVSLEDLSKMSGKPKERRSTNRNEKVISLDELLSSQPR